MPFYGGAMGDKVDSKMTMDIYAQLEQRVDRNDGESFDQPVRKA